jgi:hypothetical protein
MERPQVAEFVADLAGWALAVGTMLAAMACVREMVLYWKLERIGSDEESPHQSTDSSPHEPGEVGGTRVRRRREHPWSSDSLFVE